MAPGSSFCCIFYFKLLPINSDNNELVGALLKVLSKSTDSSLILQIPSHAFILSLTLILTLAILPFTKELLKQFMQTVIT